MNQLDPQPYSSGETEAQSGGGHPQHCRTHCGAGEGDGGAALSTGTPSLQHPALPPRAPPHPITPLLSTGGGGGGCGAGINARITAKILRPTKGRAESPPPQKPGMGGGGGGVGGAAVASAVGRGGMWVGGRPGDTPHSVLQGSPLIAPPNPPPTPPQIKSCIIAALFVQLFPSNFGPEEKKKKRKGKS